MDINKAFSILQQFEGGDKVTDIRGDMGGLTKYGISKVAHPDLDIASLTEVQAISIYEKDYWEASSCAKLKPELKYIHFDTAVNIGVGTAIKLLQQVSGVVIDGKIGSETLTKSCSVTPGDYLLCRLMHYNEIMANNTTLYMFCKGWANRIAVLFAMHRNNQLL